MVMLTTAILKMVSFCFFFVAKVLIFLVGDYRFVLRFSVNFFLYN
jgi:hypothetical protein